MKIKGQLQWTDYLNSSLLHLKPTGLARILFFVLVIFLGFGAVIGLYLSFTGKLPFELSIFVLGFLAFIVLHRYVFLPNRVKKIFSQQKELSLPFEIEFTDIGLIAVNELGNSTRPWKNFFKWKENNDLFLLYHSDVMYTIIPKRFFIDLQQIDIVRSHLIDNQVPVAKPRSMGILFAFYIILLIVIVSVLAAVLRR